MVLQGNSLTSYKRVEYIQGMSRIKAFQLKIRSSIRYFC